MRKNATKLAAAVLSLAMVMTSVNMPASAAKTKVKLNKTKATLYVNGSASEKATTLKVTVNGKKVNATFKSSNTKVLTVAKKTGKVTAKKNGTAKVTATYKKKKYNCTVTVKTYATSVSITSAKTLNLAAGKTATINATVKPSTASNKKVSFASSDKNVATVTSAGKVTAKKAGTATVTVKALGSKKAAKKATVKVNVKAAAKPTTEPTTEPTTTPTTAPTATPETPVATEGAITVTTNVSGASIKITDGTTEVATDAAIGTTFTADKLKEGSYTVIVSKEGFVTSKQVVVVKAGETTPITVNLEADADKVIGITSDNLVTFDVEFSKPVDEKTITADSFKVYKNNNSAPLVSGRDYSYMLSDDNKTIKVIAGNSEQLTKYKVVVEGIKTKDTKKEFEKAEKEITLKDVTAPTVKDIQITSKKTVKVFYSEPMNIAVDQTMVLDDELKINGTQVLKAKNTAFDLKDNSVVYTLDKALETGTYEISTEGAKDYAGWKTAETKKSVSYTVKTTAPTIVSATAKEKNKVSVVFSAPIDKAGTIEMGKSGSQATFDLSKEAIYATGASLADKANSAYTTIKKANSVAVVQVSDTKFDFYFSDDYALTTADIVESVIKYNKIKDLDGNEVTSEQKFKFKAENDNDIPTVTSIKADGQKLVITFSEAMNQAAVERIANYVFKAKTGVKEFNPTNAAYDSYNNTVTLTFSTDDVSNAGGTFGMTIKDLKDASVRANDMATVSKDVTFADTKAPTVSKVEVVAGDDKVTPQKLIVSFDKAMDKATIENLSNYIITFGGKKIVLSNWAENGKKATAVAGTGNQSVTITLGGLYSDKTDGTNSANSNKGIDTKNDTLTILGVKDSLGNVYVDVTEAKAITLYSKSVDFATAVKSVELTSKKTIKVTLKDDASVFDKVYAGEFKLIGSSSQKVPQPYKAEIAADKKSVTLTLTDDITATGAGYTLKVVPEDNNAKTFNVAGQYFVDNTGVSLTDKAAPSVDKVMSAAKAKVAYSTLYTSSSLTDDCIVVKFDEAVTTDKKDVIPSLFTVKADDTTLSYADGDYELVTKDGSTAYDGTSADEIVIKIKKDGINSKKVTVALTDGSYLKDADGNKANKFDAKSVEMKDDADKVVEKTAPIVKKSAVSDDGNTITLTLSEAVKATQAELNNIAVSGVTPITVKLSDDGKTITITGTGFSGTSKYSYTPTSGSEIKDANGNAMTAISETTIGSES